MPEKDFSLLKPYTNYDKIRDMSIDEMTIVLAAIDKTSAKVIINDLFNVTEFKETRSDLLNAIEKRNTHIFKFWKKWLESEAEKCD